MADGNEIMVRQMRDRQLSLARIMSRNGRCLKTVALESGIPYNTLRSYFPGERDAIPANIPLSAVCQLIGVLPDEWLSVLTEPEGRRFASDTEPNPVAALTEVRDFIAGKLSAIGGRDA